MHGDALRKLKKTLTRQPVLRGVDPSKPYRLHVDDLIQASPIDYMWMLVGLVGV